MSTEFLGWFLWCLMALPAIGLIWQAIESAIQSWRWKRAWKRGEIKTQPFRERLRAEYLGAERMGSNR